MGISTALVLAMVFFVALWMPYFIFYIRGGKKHGHTWFTWWKPRATRTSDRMLAFDRLDLAPTMRVELDTDRIPPDRGSTFSSCSDRLRVDRAAGGCRLPG